MKLGLSNIRTLLKALGNPETNYLKVQVAGTNGKGSVCAFLDSICREAGIRTGVFTSPHLISIIERIRIQGRDISEDDFAALATKVRNTSERLVTEGNLATVPTYFEQVTAMALVAFADSKVELAILETGLGGRFDATTAANAEIAAITRIDLDHQEYLGDTIEDIAAEKAAIIREDSEVVISHQSLAAERAILGRCREVGVDPRWASTEIKIKNEPDILPALYGSIKTSKTFYGHLEFWNMLGKHQFENAAVAIGIAEILQEDGLSISIDQTVSGLNNATHAGRLEYDGRYLFDGAHNLSGAMSLRLYLDEFVSRPITIVYGAMKDKEIAGIAEILFPAADKIILTRPDNSRAISAEEIAGAAIDLLNHDRCFLTVNVAEALAKADEVADENSVILVTGSLYLVGEAKRILSSQI